MRRFRKRAGVVLILVSVLLFVLLAVVGCLLDLSRVMIARSALQAQLESAALAAVLELDGTSAGLERARIAATGADPGQSPTVIVEFASAPGQSFQQAPLHPGTARLVRVTAAARVPLTLVRVAVRDQDREIRAHATAAQQEVAVVSRGLFPYAVVAHAGDGADPNLTPGTLYTLRRSDTGGVCPGDQAASTPPFAGFVGSSDPKQIREAILAGTQIRDLAIGDAMDLSQAPGTAEAAPLAERIAQDTDSSADFYAAYASLARGNGRRLVALPIRSPRPEGRILQFGAFFLLPAERYQDPANQPFCAEYLGPFLQGSRWKGAGEPGYYAAVLLP